MCGNCWDTYPKDCNPTLKGKGEHFGLCMLTNWLKLGILSRYGHLCVCVHLCLFIHKTEC